MKAPEPIQAEIRNKVAEIATQVKALRAEYRATTYTALKKYGVQSNAIAHVLAGKQYTLETLLLLLHEVNYTITLTPKAKKP